MSAQPEPQDQRPCCPSFVSFGCSHSGTRTRVSTGSGWSTGRSVLRIAAGFSVTYSCPARTRRVLTSGVQRFHWRASVIDVSRVVLLTALGHSMFPRQCVLACDPLGRALGPACGAVGTTFSPTGHGDRRLFLHPCQHLLLSDFSVFANLVG